MRTLAETGLRPEVRGILEIPVYRRTVSTFERAEDGRWVAASSPYQLTTFEPVPDSDRVIEYPRPARDYRIVIAGGSEPVAWLRGARCELVFCDRGQSYLRTPKGRELPAFAALLDARSAGGELAMIPRREWPGAGEPARPEPGQVVEQEAARPEAATEPARPEFRLGEGGGGRPRKTGRKGREMAGDAPGWGMSPGVGR